MADPVIREVVLASGKKRYRFVADVGVNPETGKRKQVTITKDTKKEAQQELNKIKHLTTTGEYIAPSKMTVSELLDIWYASATVDVEAATVVSYRTAIRAPRERLGQLRVQELTEDHVDAMVAWMLTSGRKQGGKPGTGLGARSVQLTLFALRSALKLAVRRRLVSRNVAEHTRIPKAATNAAMEKRAAQQPWSAAEVQQFLSYIAPDRLYAVLLLSLMGLRPEEVAGLRWEDVDLSGGGSLSIRNARTLVESRMVEKRTKSNAGTRNLPLPTVALTALKGWKAQQGRERLALGEAYRVSGYVLTDNGGEPVKLDAFRRYVQRLMKDGGLRRVRLYDARHACLSWMANNGVSDTVVSAWAGHADLSFTKRRYVHSDAETLREASDRLGDFLSVAK